LSEKLMTVSASQKEKGQSRMSHIHVETERVIDAPPAEVFAFLADYRQKHPMILTPNFLDYNVEQGGVGAGTVIRYRLQAAGRERPYHMQIDEPEKGRMLREHDTNSSLFTTWTVDQGPTPRQSRVTVSTHWEGGSGMGGFFERTFAPMGLRGIYTEMLNRLEQSLAGSATAAR
jgi:uncharacterized protein YndB with AHSA1/START domain